MNTLLVEAVDTIPEAIAWMCILAFQTTSTTLHTSTVPLFSLLWDTSLRVDNNEAVFTLMRRVLSATMHYCSPESFRPVAELVVTRVQMLCDTIVEEEPIHRTLQMTLVVAALRKSKKAESMFTGERYSTLFAPALMKLADQIATILSKLSVIPLSGRLKDDVCAILVACLKGGGMSLWVRGRAALEHLWEVRFVRYLGRMLRIYYLRILAPATAQLGPSLNLTNQRAQTGKHSCFRMCKGKVQTPCATISNGGIGLFYQEIRSIFLKLWICCMVSSSTAECHSATMRSAVL